MITVEYASKGFIAKILLSFLLGVISTLFVLSLLTSCSEPPQPAYTKKVVIVKIDQYREINTLQEYQIKWKATLSDGNVIVYTRLPIIGDTITYRYYSIKK
jgi:hypothetical protein